MAQVAGDAALRARLGAAGLARAALFDAPAARARLVEIRSVASHTWSQK
jgi:hypothetical protein